MYTLRPIFIFLLIVFNNLDFCVSEDNIPKYRLKLKSIPSLDVTYNYNHPPLTDDNVQSTTFEAVTSEQSEVKVNTDNEITKISDNQDNDVTANPTTEKVQPESIASVDFSTTNIPKTVRKVKKVRKILKNINEEKLYIPERNIPVAVIYDDENNNTTFEKLKQDSESNIYINRVTKKKYKSLRRLPATTIAETITTSKDEEYTTELPKELSTLQNSKSDFNNYSSFKLNESNKVTSEYATTDDSTTITPKRKYRKLRRKLQTSSEETQTQVANKITIATTDASTVFSFDSKLISKNANLSTKTLTDHPVSKDLPETDNKYSPSQSPHIEKTETTTAKPSNSRVTQIIEITTKTEIIKPIRSRNSVKYTPSTFYNNNFVTPTEPTVKESTSWSQTATNKQFNNIYRTTTTPSTLTTARILSREQNQRKINERPIEPRTRSRSTTTSNKSLENSSISPKVSHASSSTNKPESPERYVTRPNRITEKTITNRTRDVVVPIVDSKNFVYSSGDFHYSYESGDGTKAFERGVLKPFEDKPSGEAVEGGYSYQDKDGNNFSLSYTADENGYRPVGAHLPTPPPIPPAIARALAHLATKPIPDYDESTRKPWQ